jgi:hypothetical protein
MTIVSKNRAWYHDHTEHNPDCDIVCAMVDGLNHSYITYVKDLKTGQESCEYYSGPNYLPFSIAKKSFSRHWPNLNAIPVKYMDAWMQMRDWYNRGEAQTLPKY